MSVHERRLSGDKLTSFTFPKLKAFTLRVRTYCESNPSASRKTIVGYRPRLFLESKTITACPKPYGTGMLLGEVLVRRRRQAYSEDYALRDSKLQYAINVSSIAATSVKTPPSQSIDH